MEQQNVTTETPMPRQENSSPEADYPQEDNLTDTNEQDTNEQDTNEQKNEFLFGKWVDGLLAGAIVVILWWFSDV